MERTQILAPEAAERVTLPPPTHGGDMTVAAALRERRSLRDFNGAAISVGEVAGLLWAAQGITHPMGLRTAPSAGALYPLECHLLAGAVTGLAAAVYRYDPRRHDLAPTVEGDRRGELAAAALGQTWMAAAPAVIAIAAVARRTTAKYGERGLRYVHIETGHAAENVYLQAAALGLGTTIVGAFDDTRVRGLLAMAPGEDPLALLPVGRP
jgi:SagB-type dehydrogenase family enzyme